MWSDEIATPVLVKTGIFAGTRSFLGIFQNFQNMRESTSQEQSFDTINVVLSQRMKTQQLFEFYFSQKMIDNIVWRATLFRVVSYA